MIVSWTMLSEGEKVAVLNEVKLCWVKEDIPGTGR